MGRLCILRFSDTVIYMISLIDRVVLDISLQPTVYRIYHFYETSVGTSALFEGHSTSSSNSCRQEDIITPHLTALLKHLTHLLDDVCNASFALLAALFSAEDWHIDLHGNLAQSDGKVYCYIQLLEELTDNLQL